MMGSCTDKGLFKLLMQADVAGGAAVVRNFTCGKHFKISQVSNLDQSKLPVSHVVSLELL